MLGIEEAPYAAGLKQSKHAHATHTVSIVLAGSLRERVGQKEEIVGALSVVVKPAGTEHHDEFGPEPVRLLRITLDPETEGVCDRFARQLTAWRWDLNAAAPPFLRLLRQLRRTRDASNAETQTAAMDALAAVGSSFQPPVPGQPPLWLRRVRDQLDDDTRPPVAALAREADVHPVYLARQFRRWYGSSISGYVQRRRAQRAAAAIVRRARTISAASHDAGFADHAHMCRVFKHVTGLTPGSFRSLVAEV